MKRASNVFEARIPLVYALAVHRNSLAMHCFVVAHSLTSQPQCINHLKCFETTKAVIALNWNARYESFEHDIT